MRTDNHRGTDNHQILDDILTLHRRQEKIAPLERDITEENEWQERPHHLRDEEQDAKAYEPRVEETESYDNLPDAKRGDEPRWVKPEDRSLDEIVCGTQTEDLERSEPDEYNGYGHTQVVQSHTTRQTNESTVKRIESFAKIHACNPALY